MKIQLIPFDNKINDQKDSKKMKQKNREHSAIAALLGIINSLTRGMSRVYKIHIHKKKHLCSLPQHSCNTDEEWRHSRTTASSYQRHQPLAGKRKKAEKKKLNIHHHRKEKLRPVQSI